MRPELHNDPEQDQVQARVELAELVQNQIFGPVFVSDSPTRRSIHRQWERKTFGSRDHQSRPRAVYELDLEDAEHNGIRPQGAEQRTRTRGSEAAGIDGHPADAQNGAPGFWGIGDVQFRIEGDTVRSIR